MTNGPRFPSLGRRHQSASPLPCIGRTGTHHWIYSVSIVWVPNFVPPPPFTVVSPVLQSEPRTSGWMPKPISGSQKPSPNGSNWHPPPKSADHLHSQTRMKRFVLTSRQDHILWRSPLLSPPQVHARYRQVGNDWLLCSARAKWWKPWSLSFGCHPSWSEQWPASARRLYESAPPHWDSARSVTTLDNFSLWMQLCVHPWQCATTYCAQNCHLSWTARCRSDGLTCSKSRSWWKACFVIHGPSSPPFYWSVSYYIAPTKQLDYPKTWVSARP